MLRKLSLARRAGSLLRTPAAVSSLLPLSRMQSAVAAGSATVPADVEVWINAAHPAVGLRDRVDARSLVRLSQTLNTSTQSEWMYNEIHGAHPAAHWLFCTEGGATKDLNADGYFNTFRPPKPFSVCMWGGGTIHFHDALRVDAHIHSVVRVSKPQFKAGRTGNMVLVSRTNDIVAKHNNKHLVRDVVNLIYRDENAAKPGPEAPLSPEQAAVRARPLVQGQDYDFERSVPFETDARTLFRFSALTWNTHRIHYDSEYAKSEGHDGVLVHGPLQATVLLDFANEISKAIAPPVEPLLERYYTRLMYRQLVLEQNEAVRARRNARSVHGPSPAQAPAHSHSHGGEPCGHNHGGENGEDEEEIPDVPIPPADRVPLDYSDIPLMQVEPWHLRYQKLRSFSYRALKPLVAGTRVRVLAQVVEDQGRADAEAIARADAEWAAHPTRRTPPQLEEEHYWKRVLPARVKVWVQDAEKSDVRYMEGEMTFTKLNKEYVGSKVI